MPPAIRPAYLALIFSYMALLSYAPAAQALRNEYTEQELVRQAIEAGDWRVVETLRRWASAPRNPPAAADVVGPDQFRLAIDGLGRFRDASSRAAVEAIFRDPTILAHQRGLAMLALARMRAPESAALVREGVRDAALPKLLRAQAAAELVAMGDVAGREHLLEGYRRYLAAFGAPDKADGTDIVVREAMKRCGDADLIRRVEALTGGQTVQVARNNIATLLERMRCAARTPEQLLALAEDTSWRNAGHRYNAIDALSDVGRPEDIPRLLTMQPWASVDSGAWDLQQRLFRENVVRAVAGIQRRHWPAMAERKIEPETAAMDKLLAAQADALKLRDALGPAVVAGGDAARRLNDPAGRLRLYVIEDRLLGQRPRELAPELVKLTPITNEHGVASARRATMPDGRDVVQLGLTGLAAERMRAATARPRPGQRLVLVMGGEIVAAPRLALQLGEVIALEPEDGEIDRLATRVNDVLKEAAAPR